MSVKQLFKEPAAVKKRPTQYYERIVYMELDEITRLRAKAELGKPIKQTKFFLMPGLNDGDLYEVQLLFTKGQAKKIDETYDQFDAMFAEKTKKFSKSSGKQMIKVLLQESATMLDELEEMGLEIDEAEQVLDLFDELNEDGATRQEIIAELDSLLEELSGDLSGAGIRRRRSKPVVASLSAAQLKQIKGRGFLSDVATGLTSFAANVADSMAPGLGTALKGPVDSAIMAIDRAITGKGMMSARELQDLRRILKKKGQRGGRLGQRRAIRSAPARRPRMMRI